MVRIIRSSCLILVAIWALTGMVPLNANVRLPKIFTSNMILQQNAKVNFWGWADQGEVVTVIGGWSGGSETATAGEDGKWSVRLQTPAAVTDGTSYTVTITGKNKKVLKDVLIGEVWLLSGQSNMVMSLLDVEGGEEAVAGANYPNLRLITIGMKSASIPQDDFRSNWMDSTWTSCTPAIARWFSAVGYYFGRTLIQNLGVPIGLILDTPGASRCEAWTRAEDMEEVTDFRGKGPWASANEDDRQSPTVLYNGMIAPVVSYTLAGVLWYQGESNVGRPKQLTELFPAMIKGWREAWGQGDFPFYFVQIAPFGGYSSPLPEFWEAQASALNLANTGMVVTLDVGDVSSKHPLKKEPVGKRLALWAEAKQYGRTDIVYSGPLFKDIRIEGDTIRLTFHYAETGLKAASGSLKQFEIEGENNDYSPASAQIDGADVLVWSSSVPDPTNVRYAWFDTATASLYNNADLPAAPFRTKTVKIQITSNPPGLTISVDGDKYITPRNFGWTPGSSHSIGIVDTLQNGATGIRYIYQNWSDAGERNHTINFDGTIVYIRANFKAQYYLTTNSNPPQGGNVLPNPLYNWYDADTQVVLSAFARTENGYEFANWIGDLTGSTNPVTLVMERPKSITGVFTLQTFCLATVVEPAAAGVIHCFPDKSTYVFGETVKITVKASSGYYQSCWIADGIDYPVSDTLVVIMYKSKLVKAKFGVTAVDDKSMAEMPNDYRLFQSYPNPFNPQSTIVFQLPKTVNVTLDIYNSSGQRLRTLLNETRSAGTHQAIWNGKDDLGNVVASGIYYYEIKTKNFHKVMKIVYMK